MYKLSVLTNLDFGIKKNGTETIGSYYKTSRIEGGKKYYYKCSHLYQSDTKCYFGDESVYEVIASRLLNILGINCVKSTLLYASINIDNTEYRTFVAKSENYFTSKYISRISIEDFMTINKVRNVKDVFKRADILDDFYKMIIADFIMIQRDRHGANAELLIDRNYNIQLAPLFDNGLSFLAPFPSKSDIDISIFNGYEDLPVNNMLGNRSLFQDLLLIDRPQKLNMLIPDHKRRIFYNLNNVLPKEYLDKIWAVIVSRYTYLRERGYIIV